MADTEEERMDPRALGAAVRHLRQVMDEAEAGEPHAVLVTDPQTGTRHVVGPYPTRLAAKIGVALTKARNAQADPDLADLEYEVVLSFAPNGDTPEVRRG